MEEDDSNTQLELPPPVIRRRSTEPTTVHQIELKQRIRNLIDSFLFEIKPSYKNACKSEASEPPAPSGADSEASSNDDTVSSASRYSSLSEQRKNSSSTTSGIKMPQFRHGAAIPNSVVRASPTISSNPSDMNSRPRGISEGSVLDKLFHRLLPDSEEIIDDDQLLARIKKELERRKLLTKSIRRSTIAKMEITKNFELDPEREHRRHTRRVTCVNMFDWEPRPTTESIRRSIEEPKLSIKTPIITDEELLKEQKAQLMLVRLPVKLSKISTLVHSHTINQSKDIYTGIKVNTDKQERDMSHDVARDLPISALGRTAKKNEETIISSHIQTPKELISNFKIEPPITANTRTELLKDENNTDFISGRKTKKVTNSHDTKRRTSKVKDLNTKNLKQPIRNNSNDQHLLADNSKESMGKYVTEKEEEGLSTLEYKVLPPVPHTSWASGIEPIDSKHTASLKYTDFTKIPSSLFEMGSALLKMSKDISLTKGARRKHKAEGSLESVRTYNTQDQESIENTAMRKKRESQTVQDKKNKKVRHKPAPQKRKASGQILKFRAMTMQAKVVTQKSRMHRRSTGDDSIIAKQFNPSKKRKVSMTIKKQ